MSELDLDALERLNAERTQGVWVSREDLLHDAERWGVLMEIHAREAAIDAQGHSYAIFGVDEEFVGDNPILQCCGSAEAKDTPNAEFIAAAANAMPELLRLARRAADAERERDEARDDYLRRHKDACDRYEEIEALKSRLAALKEKCAPFVREAALWPEYCRDSDAVFIADVDDVEPLLEEAAAEGHGRITYSKDITVGDLRELARAVNGEEKQEAGE